MKIAPNKRKALLKRSADFFEKFSIASFAVGIFQTKTLGILFGICCLCFSMFITYKEIEL